MLKQTTYRYGTGIVSVFGTLSYRTVMRFPSGYVCFIEALQNYIGRMYELSIISKYSRRTNVRCSIHCNRFHPTWRSSRIKTTGLLADFTLYHSADELAIICFALLRIYLIPSTKCNIFGVYLHLHLISESERTCECRGTRRMHPTSL
jgi:hypothetical protein